MMELVRDLELPAEIDNLVQGEIDREELTKLFDFLEFRSLHDRLSEVLGGEVAGGSSRSVDVLEAEITAYETPAEAVVALSAASAGSGVLALAVPEHGIDDGLGFRHRQCHRGSRVYPFHGAQTRRSASSTGWLARH